MSRRGPLAALAGPAGLVLSTLILVGCSPSDLTPPPAESRVEVDTPALREAKQAAGIAACPASTDEVSELPDVTLPCLGGGNEVSLRGVRGPAVLPLWASWCDPCKEELPLFARLAQDLGDRADVLGVNYEDTQPDLALELLEESGARFPQVADPSGTLAETFRIRGLPGIVWVAEDGSVLFRNDRVRDYAELRALVSSQLDIDVGAAG